MTKFLITSEHRYGKSYWNSDVLRFGAKVFATRYEDYQEACDATCELQELPYEAWALYDSPNIEEVNDEPNEEGIEGTGA